jgi:hypothetical protein
MKTGAQKAVLEELGKVTVFPIDLGERQRKSTMILASLVMICRI